jgi:hypothetical protein
MGRVKPRPIITEPVLRSRSQGPRFRQAHMFSSPFLSGQKGRKKPPGLSSRYRFQRHFESLSQFSTCRSITRFAKPLKTRSSSLLPVASSSSNTTRFATPTSWRSPLSSLRTPTASAYARTRKRAAPFYGSLCQAIHTWHTHTHQNPEKNLCSSV